MDYVNPEGSTIEFEFESRSESDGNNLVFRGLAARTNHDYLPWARSQVRERIDGAAFRSIADDNVVMLIEHQGLPLASTRAGTLKLEVTERGLEYRAEVPSEDPDGVRLMAKIKSGAVWGSSLTMLIKDQEWAEGRRVIKDAQVFDVSPVGRPANPATTVGVVQNSQSLDDVLVEVRKMTEAFQATTEEVESPNEVEVLRLRAKRLALADIVA